MRYEYRVCQIQDARVTYVNAQWQGQLSPASSNVGEALRSCPEESSYLNMVGEEGWRLVCVSSGVGGNANARVLYLQRDRG